MAGEDPLATLDDPRAGVGLAALENPAAQEDFRESPEFEELESEFRKMETGGPNAVNWKQLNEETVKVLQSNSKDLVLATRLVFGLFAEEGYPGLATGLVILRDLSEAHWDTMVP
ncbi:MAG: type VI secretion system ImpA family N-terminal domain-containing protein, partial [Sulfitobacter sp.]